MGFLSFLTMEKYNTAREELTLVDMRPIIPLEQNQLDTEMETFQNKTLRPILKMQHNVLLDVLLLQPNVESILKYRERRFAFRDRLKVFLNQAQLKGMFIGMIIGQFTREEMKFYLQNTKEGNKRIINMTIDRLADSI
jgi:hypothetical protein